MTGQTISRSPALLMARDAPSHLQCGGPGCGGHLLHVSVTGRALQPVGEMTLMGEVDEIRKALQSNLRDRALFLPVIEQCLDACAPAVNVLVTSHAELHARDARRR